MSTEQDNGANGAVDQEQDADGECKSIKCEQISVERMVSASLAAIGLVPGQFLYGAQFSPDGLCVLAAATDDALRLFELPKSLWPKESVHVESSTADALIGALCPVLTCREGESVFDFCWYPLMTSLDPRTCCFVSTSRDHPLHLWDAYNGRVRMSYMSVV